MINLNHQYFYLKFPLSNCNLSQQNHHYKQVKLLTKKELFIDFFFIGFDYIF